MPPQSANIPDAFTTMAIARVSTNPMYKGGAGGYSFYVRGGEQVVRQRKNNSNYGDSASRTQAQMRRRVMWANLVNFYKVNKFWMPKAFELRSAGQTDYNRFMQLNIPFSEHALTKEQALLGVCAPFTMQVSEGSLPAIQYDNSAAVPFVTDIKITGTYTAGTQTVAQLSQDIIANNPRWKDGDNLAIVRIEMAPYDGNPYIIPHFYEFTLNTADTTTILNTLDVFTNSGVAFSGGFVSYPLQSDSNSKYAFVMIHTRKEGGKLLVSTQELIVKTDNYYSLTEPQHVEDAIASYGVDAEVPLDPGEGGSISSGALSRLSVLLTGNGETIAQSDTFPMVPGHYRMTASPNLWSTETLQDSTNVVMVFATSAPGTAGSTIFFESKANIDESEGLGTVEFDVPNNAPYVALAIRADSAATVQLTAVKM